VAPRYDDKDSEYSLADFVLPATLEKFEKQGGRIFLYHSEDDSVVPFVDFEKYKKAKPIKNISWEKYLKLVPPKRSPGSHFPVDPVAAKLAMKKKIKVIVADGKKLDNLKNILDGQGFKGTTIF